MGRGTVKRGCSDIQPRNLLGVGTLKESKRGEKKGPKLGKRGPFGGGGEKKGVWLGGGGVDEKKEKRHKARKINLADG